MKRLDFGVQCLLCFFILFNLVSCSSDEQNNLGSVFQTNLGVGQSAKDLVSDNTFSKLIIEIGYMQGHELSNSAEQDVVNFVNQFMNKSEGVEVVQTEIPSLGQENYTTQDLRSIESENRQVFPSDNTLSIWVSIVDGKNQNESVVGVAYQNLSISLMGATISENSGGLNQPTKASIEATIFMHELGHLMGLVNIGAPMVNNHQQNGNHCDNSECLMFATVETTDFFSLLIATPIPELDENCQLDLQQLIVD